MKMSRKIENKNEINDIYNEFMSSCMKNVDPLIIFYSQYKTFMYDSVALAR